MGLCVSQNVSNNLINLYIAKRRASFSVPCFALISISGLNSLLFRAVDEERHLVRAQRTQAGLPNPEHPSKLIMPLDCSFFPQTSNVDL